MRSSGVLTFALEAHLGIAHLTRTYIANTQITPMVLVVSQRRRIGVSKRYCLAVTTHKVSISLRFNIAYDG